MPFNDGIILWHFGGGDSLLASLLLLLQFLVGLDRARVLGEKESKTNDNNKERNYEEKVFQFLYSLH